MKKKKEKRRRQHHKFFFKKKHKKKAGEIQWYRKTDGEKKEERGQRDDADKEKEARGRQGESEAEKQMAAERRQIETCWDSQRGTAGSMESQKNVSGKGREGAGGREGKTGQRERGCR